MTLPPTAPLVKGIQEFEKDLPRCTVTIPLVRDVVQMVCDWSPLLAGLPFELKLRGEHRHPICNSVAELDALPPTGALRDAEWSIRYNNGTEAVHLEIELNPDRPSVLRATIDCSQGWGRVSSLHKDIHSRLNNQQILEGRERSATRRQLAMPMLSFDKDAVVGLETTLVLLIAKWLEATPSYIATGIKVDQTDDASRDATVHTINKVAWPPSRQSQINFRIEQHGTVTVASAIVHIPFVPKPGNSTPEVKLVTTGLQSEVLMREIEQVITPWLNTHETKGRFFTLGGTGRAIAGLGAFFCGLKFYDNLTASTVADAVVFGAGTLAAVIYFFAVPYFWPNVWYSDSKRNSDRAFWLSVFQAIEGFLMITVVASLVLGKIQITPASSSDAPKIERARTEQKSKMPKDVDASETSTAN